MIHKIDDRDRIIVFQVLQEVMDYGAYKGILPPPKPDFYQQKQQEVLGMMKQNPDAVANLLKAWLGDDD